MNNTNPEQPVSPDDAMLAEYDFSNGVRGKHYQAYRRGHSVAIHRQDGTSDVQHFTLAEGAVMLDPDVREYFGDADAVNHALRMLIRLIPAKRTAPPAE